MHINGKVEDKLIPFYFITLGKMSVEILDTVNNFTPYRIPNRGFYNCQNVYVPKVVQFLSLIEKVEL